jgi:hypothetical protein
MEAVVQTEVWLVPELGEILSVGVEPWHAKIYLQPCAGHLLTMKLQDPYLNFFSVVLVLRSPQLF